MIDYICVEGQLEWVEKFERGVKGVAVACLVRFNVKCDDGKTTHCFALDETAREICGISNGTTLKVSGARPDGLTEIYPISVSKFEICE
jgi:hypothetical protein